MMTTKSPAPAPRVAAPAWVAALVFLGAASALAGAYWDDAWHTERGRDSFFIAPHIAIYAGVTGAGFALSAWALLVARRGGTHAIRGHLPLVLALLSVLVTLASGPIDNIWHVAFGRDAVIWSPPHMLGIAGTLALAASMLVELARRPSRRAQVAATAAGGLVLASGTFAVAEYETDVPQFDELWYLPVLAFTAAIALLLVRLASQRRWAATEAAAAYTVFMVAVSAFLPLVGFSPPALPLLVVPALAIDLASRRQWSGPVSAGAYALSLFAVYVPVRNWLGDGVETDAADVALGLPLAWVASALLFAVARGRLPAVPRSATAAPAVLLILLVLPSAALAHDPGQGDDAGELALTVSADGADARLRGVLPQSACGATQPRTLVARRGGQTLRAPLRKRGCQLTGAIRLPDRGRWFLYAEMSRDGKDIESWLPIDAHRGRRLVSDDARYAYIPPSPRRTASSSREVWRCTQACSRSCTPPSHSPVQPRRVERERRRTAGHQQSNRARQSSGSVLPARGSRSRFSATALTATMMLEPAIELAATSGRRTKPSGSNTPAATGSASEL